MSLWIILIIFFIHTLYKIEKSVSNFKAGFISRVMTAFNKSNIEVASAVGVATARYIIDKLKPEDSKKKK